MSATNSERDPRLDPRPGDRVKQSNWTRRIYQWTGSRVFCSGMWHHDAIINVSSWRKWAKGGEVIHRGGDA